MTEALEAMRRALGPDAVIVASREDARGVRITAAVEREDDLHLLAPESEAAPSDRKLLDILTWHGLPEHAARILLAGEKMAPSADPVAALAAVLGQRCGPGIGSLLQGVRAVVGAPGVGKTLVAAKLATAAALAGRRVRVFHADDARAGEASRLRELLAPLEIAPRPLSTATADELAATETELVVVDLPGVDPTRGTELARLAQLVASARGRPLVVWPAGADPVDACDAASNFAALGVRDCIVTRIDLARRLGSLLAAVACGLRLAALGIGPSLDRPLVTVSPVRLATLIVERASPSRSVAACRRP